MSTSVFVQTAEFNSQIIELPVPPVPQRLSPIRKAWALEALGEEITEFEDATTLEDEVDALIDLMYFAAGRLYEMGVDGDACFAEVHRANMCKKQGSLSKRPSSLGYDAIKPKGWTPPNLSKFLVPKDLTSPPNIHQIQQSLNNVGKTVLPSRFSYNNTGRSSKIIGAERGASPEKANILIMGYGQHGKDTVAEIISANYGYSFMSSSEFCAKEILFEATNSPAIELLRDPVNSLGTPIPGPYRDWHECFEDRGNHRQFWYETINQYNTPDASRLGTELFSQYDIYCGLRHPTEFNALNNKGILDLVLWVDASERVPIESKTSCNVAPWMANFVIDNNRGPDALEANVAELFDYLVEERLI